MECNVPCYRQRVIVTTGKVDWTNKQFLYGEAIAVALAQ
jgi:hypothetical protein